MQQVIAAVASTVTLHPPKHTGYPGKPHPGHPHPGHPHPPGHHGPDHHLQVLHDGANKPALIALWVFFGVFTAGIAGVAYLGARVPARARVFHALSALALTITATTYFLLATGVGVAPAWVQGARGHGGAHRGHGHPGHGHGHHGHSNFHHGVHNGTTHEEPTWHLRQTFWLRDLAHTLTAPLLIAQLALLAGIAPLTGLVAIIASGFSAFVTAQANHFANRTKFHPRAQFVGYIVVGLLFMLVTFSTLFVQGVGAARLRRSKTKGLFYVLTLHTFVSWVLIGVFFLLGTGLNILSVTAEVIILGIFDIAAQLGFIGVLLFLHVHDDEDPTWVFPAWFVENRGGEGGDGRGSYAVVAAE